MTAIATKHTPVLLEECVELLAPALQNPGAVMIDCTLGMGGHSEAVLRALPNANVIGIDRDPQAIELASKRLATFGNRFTAVHATYDQIDRVAQEYGRGGKVDAVLFDLGVSSLQLDEGERGFSYAQDAPLDMRMNQAEGKTARDILATASASEISRILREYGEEKFANKIAQNIVKARAEKPLETTFELVEIVRNSIPAPARRQGGNPAKRTFQALRIAVNEELEILFRALPKALAAVEVGGRVVVESYQSLEDRFVKKVFRDVTSVDVPAGLPLTAEQLQAEFKSLTRGAHRASDDEISQNRRATPVRLRAVERQTEQKEMDHE